MALRKEIRANPSLGYTIYTRMICPLKSYLNQKINQFPDANLKIDDIYDEEDIFRFIAETSFVSIKNKHQKYKKSKLPWNNVKRGRSGYLFFTIHMRKQITDEKPGMSVGDLAKTFSDMWKRATPAERAPFEDMARKDRERYLREREEAINEYNRHRIIKPKKPTNAWTYFMKHDTNREKVGIEAKKEGKTTLQIYHEMWKRLTPEEQSTYEKMAEQDKLRYQKELEVYHEKVLENREKKMGLNRNKKDDDELIVPSDDDISEFQDEEDNDSDMEEEISYKGIVKVKKSSHDKKSSQAKKSSKTMNLKMEEDSEEEEEEEDEDEDDEEDLEIDE